MPVAIKRTSVGKQAEDVDERADLIRASAEQLVRYQDIALTAMNRFARGWTMRQEQHWEWEEPDLEADPETWPPLAKLLWLFDQAYSAVGACQFNAAVGREQPEWCPECHDGDTTTPKGWRFGVCPLHVPRSCIPPIATGLGLRGWEEQA